PDQRLLPVLPGAALLIAVALERVIAAWQRVVPNRRLAVAVAGAALGATLVMESAFYFLDYAPRDFDRWQDAEARRVLAGTEGEHYLIMVGPSPYGMQYAA